MKGVCSSSLIYMGRVGYWLAPFRQPRVAESSARGYGAEPLDCVGIPPARHDGRSRQLGFSVQRQEVKVFIQPTKLGGSTDLFV